MPKKLFALLIFSIILLSQASFALASEVCDPCPCNPPASECIGDECQKPGEIALCPATEYRTIPELVESITNAVFTIGVILFPLMILWGAFTFMTAAGRPEKIETGKKIMFWSIVGLALILFSRAIISIVKSILSG